LALKALLYYTSDRGMHRLAAFEGVGTIWTRVRAAAAEGWHLSPQIIAPCWRYARMSLNSNASQQRHSHSATVAAAVDEILGVDGERYQAKATTHTSINIFCLGSTGALVYND
jgi:hypothetical protein